MSYVNTLEATPGRHLRAARLRLSGFFWRHRWAKGLLLLAPPLLAFGLVYLASLAALFISSFWTVNSFTTEIEHIWNVDNFRTIWESGAYRSIALRTIGIAASVTVSVAVLLPLWSSYLIRVYIWRLILNQDGVLNWSLNGIGLPDQHLAYSNWAVWIVFSYVWLPFMILPVYGALERLPHSLIEASRDLGAGGFETFRRIVLPLALPGVIAGSIFTFSLTLGDYVTPLLAGGAGSQFIGNVVYSSVGISNNVPFAAAFATIPLVVMAVYLLIARRLGAFEAM